MEATDFNKHARKLAHWGLNPPRNREERRTRDRDTRLAMRYAYRSDAKRERPRGYHWGRLKIRANEIATDQQALHMNAYNAAVAEFRRKHPFRYAMALLLATLGAPLRKLRPSHAFPRALPAPRSNRRPARARS